MHDPFQDGAPATNPAARPTFAQLPVPHQYVIAIGALGMAVSGVYQLTFWIAPAFGTFSGGNVLVGLLSEVSIGATLVALALAAVMCPERSALALTRLRIAILGVVIASILIDLAVQHLASGQVAHASRYLAGWLPGFMVILLGRVVAVRTGEKALRLWFDFAVIAKLAGVAWSLVMGLLVRRGQEFSPIPEPLIMVLAVVLSAPGAIAGILLARRVVIEIKTPKQPIYPPA